MVLSQYLEASKFILHVMVVMVVVVCGGQVYLYPNYQWGGAVVTVVAHSLGEKR